MRTDEIANVVERTGELVAEHYVFPDIGKRLAEELRDGLANGRYQSVDDPDALSTAVTDDLRSVNGDQHLRLVYHSERIPDVPDDRILVEMLTKRAGLTMGGVAKVERLVGNVGYLDLSPLLFPPSIAGEAITAAMCLIATTDALIIDLRRSAGGDPHTVALICGYLFDEPVHLITICSRVDEAQSWSQAYVPGARFGGTKPIYVLTSADTFSGGEELSYDLRQHGRATIVGERTRGGAHPRLGFRVHPHLEATVPIARPVHPVSGGNWEGIGVVPDIAVPAQEALTTAHREALSRVRDAAGDSAAEAAAALEAG